MASRRPNPEERKENVSQPGTGRHKAGEAALHSMNVSASELQLYLKGMNYPASKTELVNKAKTNGAPQNVMDFFSRMPEKQYGGPTVVEEEFGKMKSGSW